MRPPLMRMEIRNAAHEGGGSGFVGMFGDSARKPTKKNPTGRHQGWDLYSPQGTSAYAITRGKVVRTCLNHPDYGGMVVLEFDHNGRTLYALYAHLRAILVHDGEPVEEGRVIGLTGATGNARDLPPIAHHLHFAIMTTPDTHLGLATYISPGHVLGYHYRGLITDDHLRLDVG
jgi:murein DD-endopeptidase MepM/ murein hydrolase activator NlpD